MMLKVFGFILFILIFSFRTFSQLSEELVTHRLVDIKNASLSTKDLQLFIEMDSSKTIIAKSTKKHKSKQLALDEAYFNSIVDNQIDVLINPIYSVKKLEKYLFFFGGYYEVQVSGFAAFYKGARVKNDLVVDNSGKVLASKELGNLDDKDNCNESEVQCLINQLDEFAKKNKQEIIEEKEFKTITDCKDCKEGSEPLRLLIVRTKKKSILDSYLKTVNK
jgi:hypothetical protein